MSVLLAFFAACSWGVSDYLAGLQSKRIHYSVVTICRELTGLGLYLLLAVFVHSVFRVSDFAIGLGVGLLTGFALPVFFGLLATGRMAVVAPVAGTVGAIVPILIGIAGGERPSLLQSVGLLLAVLAVAFVSIEHRHDEDNQKTRHIPVRDIVTAAICGIAFGMFYAGMHHTSDDSGFWPLAGVALSMTIVITVWKAVTEPRVLRQFTPNVFRMCAIGGALECLAGVLYILATREGFLSITAAVASLYPVGTALLAAYLLKEKLSVVNVAGLGLCAGGLAFIAA